MMQFRLVVLASAIAVAALTPTSHAAECTKAELDTIDKLDDDPAMDKACPDMDDGGSFDFEKIDPKAWAKASPCANTTCAAYLKDQVTKVPNCTIEKVNMKDVYSDKLTLCMDVASGKLSAAEIDKRITSFIGSWDGSDDSDWDGSGSDDFDWDDSGSYDFDDDHKNHKKNRTATKSSTANKNATNTTTPTPTPSKSNAMTVAMAGSVAVMTTVLAALL